MRILTILFCSVIFVGSTYSQNSLINNYNFETTNWQDIAWFSQTNSGSPIIVNQNDPFFSKDGIVAKSGIHFAYIGGVQSPSGLYEGELAQQFYIPEAGEGRLNFFVRYIRNSVDPGSVVEIFIDGEEVWSVSPHYIMNSSEAYTQEFAELGYLSAGYHTIQVKGYENPLGGDLPMQLAFDDFTLQTQEPTASIENEENIGLTITCLPNMIQLQTSKPINQDATIQLIDLSGKVVSSSVTYLENSYTLPVNGLGTGIYIIHIMTHTQTISQKLFIQN